MSDETLIAEKTSKNGAAEAVDKRGEKPNPSRGGWKVSNDHWQTMERFEDWQTAVRTMNMPLMREIMAECISKWPYDGDPADPQTYRTCPKKAWKEASERIREANANFLQSLLDEDS